MRAPVLRRSLNVSLVEGVFAELVGACAAGGVLTAWALYLDLSPVLIGVLGALPFTAQLVQLPAAWVTRRFGGRRTALWTIALSRQFVLPLAALPFLHVSLAAKQSAFLACTFAGALLSVVGNNAWTSWMGDLVPGSIRGRYFGRRNAVCALADTVTGLAAGAALDLGRNHARAGLALAGLSLVASLAGLVTTWLLPRQHEPRNGSAPRAASLRETISPLRDPLARRLLSFQLAWSAAGGLALAFYPLHMVGNLKLTFAAMALYAGGLTAFKMAASPLWGRALDRGGSRTVLVASAFLLCLSPLLWLAATPQTLWPLAVDAAICGAASAGQSLALFSLPLALSRPANRSFYVGALAAAGGAATAVASAAGGLLVKHLPGAWSLFGHPLVAAHALFLVGGAARFVAAFTALRVRERPLARVLDLPRRAAPQRAKLSA